MPFSEYSFSLVWTKCAACVVVVSNQTCLLYVKNIYFTELKAFIKNKYRSTDLWANPEPLEFSVFQYSVSLFHNRSEAFSERRLSEVQWRMLQTAVRAQISGQVCCASFREAAALQGYQSKYTFALICCNIYSKHSPPWKHSVSGEQSAPLIRGNLKGHGAAQESQNVFEWSRYDYDRNRPKIQPVCAWSPRQRVCLKVPNFQIKKENFFKKGKECDVCFRDGQQDRAP